MPIEDDKEVAYYAAMTNAWFKTKFEYDKSLLFLSAGSIGLLITLLTAVGVQSLTLLTIYIISLISFITCIGYILAIFLRNGKYLEDVIAGKNSNDSLLGVFDKRLRVAFIIGIISASTFGISIAFDKVNIKEIKMSDKKEPEKNIVPLVESYDGVNNIKPQNSKSIDKSLDGVQNFVPQNPETAKPSLDGVQNIAPPINDEGESEGTSRNSLSSDSSQSEDSNSEKE